MITLLLEITYFGLVILMAFLLSVIAIGWRRAIIRDKHKDAADQDAADQDAHIEDAQWAQDHGIDPYLQTR